VKTPDETAHEIHTSSLSPFQLRARAVRIWFHRKFWAWVIAAAMFGVMTLPWVEKLHYIVRLARLGHTEPVIVEEGINRSRGNSKKFLFVMEAKLVGSDRIYPANRLFNKGDKAFLTYSDRLGYGVITHIPPKSFLTFIAADPDALQVMIIGAGVFGIFTITNLTLMFFALVEYGYNRNVRETINGLPAGAERIVSGIFPAILDAFWAVLIAVLLLAAPVAAFSASAKMESQGPWPIRIVYGTLLLFLASHVTAYAVVGLLRLFQSRIGLGIKELIGNLFVLFALLGVLVHTIKLIAGDHILELNSWWDLVKEFVKSLFG
jgi:hypothetical protein